MWLLAYVVVDYVVMVYVIMAYTQVCTYVHKLVSPVVP